VWVKTTDKGVIVFVKVLPGASTNTIGGIVEGPLGQGYLKVKITQIAEGGKANQALIKFLSKAWRIPMSKIMVVAGHVSRHKQLLITDVTCSYILGAMSLKY
jgi:uncharacterized protein